MTSIIKEQAWGLLIQMVVLNDTNNHVKLLTKTLLTKNDVMIEDSVLSDVLLLFLFQIQCPLIQFTLNV